MNPLLLQNHPRSASLELQKAKQHGIALALYAAVALLLLLAALFWGGVRLADRVTVAMVAMKFIFLPLIFMAVELGSIGYALVLYFRLRREKPDEPVQRLGLWADLETGERSPAKSGVAFSLFMVVLAAGAVFLFR